MGFKQIARKLGMSEIGAKKAFARGMEKLREYLRNQPALAEEFFIHLENKNHRAATPTNSLVHRILERSPRVVHDLPKEYAIIKEESRRPENGQGETG